MINIQFLNLKMHTGLRRRVVISLLSIVIILISLFSLKALAFTNIDPIDRYAWNDVIGWIDFYSTNTVLVSESNLGGYANSSVGYIAFDCGTSPTPPADCGTTYPDWKVANDGLGNLSGWAWNDQIGWISFDCHNTSNCSQYNYQVRITTNEFSGWAWNDVIGWISFNCSNSYIGDTCATSNYRVKSITSSSVMEGTVISSTYDTGAAEGVVYNTLIYQGAKPTGTQIKFQFAASNSESGPWNFSGYDGTSTTYYVPTSPNIPVALNPTIYNNKRYFRYKLLLYSNWQRTISPEVSEVVATWSR